MRLRFELHITKKLVIALLAIVLLVSTGVFVFLKEQNKVPLPVDLKQHVKFKVLYPQPKQAQIQASSYIYQSKERILTFKADYAGTTIVFTQQPAPLNIGKDTQSYAASLGIHPYAQFQTNLGQVALTKFYQSGNLKLFSQSAVLVSQGTLLTATSEKPLTNQQWKNLLDSLKITK